VVHFQFTPFLGLHAWLARALGTGKIIFTDHHSHEEDAVLKRAPLWKRLAGRWLNSPVSVVATVSEFNRSVLREQGTCASSSIQVVYNGSDLSLPEAAHSSGAAFRRKFGIPMDRILVTQVSSMVPQKGIPDLLEAVRIALPSVPALHCALVGDGTKSAEYARLAAEMGIAGHITWTGLSLFPMADGVFAGSDIICQASRWHEAFGLGISEAMAWAKPVVATTVGGIPEVVEDGNTGILVPPRSPTALAAALVRLAIHPAFRQQLGEAGRKRAQLKFDVRSNVETLLKFYEVSGNP
jgi:glycosyltransferase involved in cell wall biosynthesis